MMTVEMKHFRNGRFPSHQNLFFSFSIILAKLAAGCTNLKSYCLVLDQSVNFISVLSWQETRMSIFYFFLDFSRQSLALLHDWLHCKKVHVMRGSRVNKNMIFIFL